jgi:hypothetical protein
MLDQMNLLSSLVSRCCADRSTIAMIVNIGLGLPESGKWPQKLRHEDRQMVHATFVITPAWALRHPARANIVNT